MGAALGAIAAAAGVVYVFVTEAAIAAGISAGLLSVDIVATAALTAGIVDLTGVTIGVTTFGAAVFGLFGTALILGISGGIIASAVGKSVGSPPPTAPSDILSGDFCTVLDYINNDGRSKNCMFSGSDQRREMRVQTGTSGYAALQYSYPEILFSR